uniref:Carboxypeptidase n=1 Tax=Daucus carota subsp. sativus TaxID=79200 RepID=A0A166DR91_DAUCS
MKNHLISLLILFSLSTISTAISSELPQSQAQKLIRDLNLFPSELINIVDANHSAPPLLSHNANRLVEKRFKFPGLATAGVSVEELGHHAGYYQIQHSYAAKMFYFFFESRNSSNDPVVIWLTGGPGCSSELALFYENGPFTIANNLSLVWNEYGWDKVSNLLYVDQPVGTGFSYTSDKRDIRHDENGVSNDLYDFLQAFFAEHPEFVKNDFFITGESYAGHYIPAFAARVYQGNKAKEGIHVNLKGFAIGNGLTDPEIQYKAYPDYALDMGLITTAEYKRLNLALVPVCEASIKLCGTDGTVACVASYVVCNLVFSTILSHAGNGINAMLVDWMRNLEVGIPALLEDGIQMLVYAGEYDLICNWLGNSRWVQAMEWSGQKEFVASSEVPFEVDGSKAGLLRSHGPLSFLKGHDAGHMVPMDQPKAALEMLRVHDAGHMVPMDQPKAALEMLRRWTRGSLSEETSDSGNLVASM